MHGRSKALAENWAPLMANRIYSKLSRQVWLAVGLSNGPAYRLVTIRAVQSSAGNYSKVLGGLVLSKDHPASAPLEAEQMIKPLLIGPINGA